MNLDNRTNFDDPQNEQDTWNCTECDKEMTSDKGVCSNACHKTSML